MAALRAHRLEVGEALLVALAPRGDAIAQPMFLGDDLAVDLVLLALLLLELAVAPGLEFGEAAVERAGAAAIEPDRVARKVLQESRSWLMMTSADRVTLSSASSHSIAGRSR